MLVSFGTFWAGEGVHVSWPGSDLAIPVLVAFYGAGGLGPGRRRCAGHQEGRRTGLAAAGEAAHG